LRNSDGLKPKPDDEDVDLSFRRLSLFESLLIGRAINAN